jgi:hypothetical protein
MKKVFLLIAVPFLLVALGFAQTPAPNSNPEQASIKGCLGGSDGNYTVAQDGTSQTFRITSSTVDLKPHLGHDVEVIGQTTNVAPSSGPSDNTVIVSGVNMISDHCATATASAPAVADPAPAAPADAPAVADATPAMAAGTPATIDPVPVAVASTPPASDPAPVVAPDAPVATDAAPAATASAPAMDSTPTPASTENSTESLPDTASSLPLLGLLGFGLLATGLLTRRLWTNQE